MQGSTFLVMYLHFRVHCVSTGFKKLPSWITMYVLRLITWRIHGEQIGEEFPAFKKLPGGRNLDQMPLSLACKLTLGRHVI